MHDTDISVFNRQIVTRGEYLAVNYVTDLACNDPLLLVQILAPFIPIPRVVFRYAVFVQF